MATPQDPKANDTEVQQPEGPVSPEVLKRISPDLDPLNQELKAAGGREGARLGSP